MQFYSFYIVSCLLLLFLALAVSKKASQEKAKNKGLYALTFCNVSKTCINYEFLRLNKDETKLIVDMHNSLRYEIAIGAKSQDGWPAASNMNALTYDKSLESLAVCAVNLCADFINYLDIYDGNNEKTSYNMRLTNKSFISREEFIFTTIKGWYSAISNTPNKLLKSYKSTGSIFKSSTQFFTQIIWAKTSKIGCAGIRYDNNNARLNCLYCFYNPPGNIEGQPIYRKGTPATRCVKINKSYSALCDASKGICLRSFNAILFISFICNFMLLN